MIGTRRHRLLTGVDVGSIVHFTVVDATERLALILSSIDEGVIARQTSDNSYWVLADFSVPTWVEITAIAAATPESRAVSTVTAAIAANVLIEGPGGPGSANMDNDLLDYSALAFASAVKVFVNGVLMEGGPLATSNHDVYPSAVTAEQQVGAFFAEFNLIIGDKIQMFAFV